MTRTGDDRLLAFLEGSLEEPERGELLDALDRDAALAERLRAAAAGLEVVRAQAALDGEPAVAARSRRRVSPWWAAASALITLMVSVPATWMLARDAGPGSSAGAPVSATDSPIPVPEAPSYVLVVHGLWPDAETVTSAETAERARRYWRWTRDLADRDLLIAAGNLRSEPGARLGPGGDVLPVAASEVEEPGFVVGMFALRVDSYDEAMAIAAESPHLDYGGRISVRRVGSGFVTVAGMGDR